MWGEVGSCKSRVSNIKKTYLWWSRLLLSSLRTKSKTEDPPSLLGEHNSGETLLGPDINMKLMGCNLSSHLTTTIKLGEKRWDNGTNNFATIGLVAVGWKFVFAFPLQTGPVFGKLSKKEKQCALKRYPGLSYLNLSLSTNDPSVDMQCVFYHCNSGSWRLIGFPWNK